MRYFIIALFLFSYSSSFAQTSAKMMDKMLTKVETGLYASKYEVSNLNFADFIVDLKKSNKTDLLKIAQIDTSNWSSKTAMNEPFVKYYHSHPAYKDYPVINISYESAQLYCNWLTEMYNSDPKRKIKKIKFRLPSESEWMQAAKGGDVAAMYAWKGNLLRNKDGEVMSNFKKDLNEASQTANLAGDNADITAPSKSYWPNAYGIYNMCGNVAEMVAEKGIAKGGSWYHSAESLNLNEKYQYEGDPQIFIGFRVFAEVLKD